MLAARQSMLRLSLSPGRASNGLPSDRVAPTHPANKDKDAGVFGSNRGSDLSCGDGLLHAGATNSAMETNNAVPSAGGHEVPSRRVHHHPDVVNPALIISTGTEGPGAIA